MAVAEPPGGRSDAIVELVTGAGAIGIVLGREAISQFESYLSTLLLWRRRLSLVATDDVHRIVTNHVLDSLSVAPFVKPGFRLADLGSGAGFPGIPLAIACPDASVDLVESRRKKANFLREAVRSAGLSNAQVIEDRAEAVDSAPFEGYELVVSRALWHIPKFLEVSRKLLRHEGIAIAMKGPKGIEESACRHDGFSSPQVVEYHLRGSERRTLFIYRKK